MCKSKCSVFRLLAIALATSLILLSPTNLLGQKSGKGRYAGRRVVLKKDAKKNGYTTKVEGMEISFEANDVEDPLTEELLEGMMRLRYRCGDEPLSDVALPFSNGRSRKLKVRCSILVEVAVQIIE